MLRHGLATAVVLLSASGCFAKPQEEIVMSPPHAAGPGEVTHGRRSTGQKMTPSLTESGFDVDVRETFECQDVTSAPTEQTVLTREHAPVAAQAGNAGAAGLCAGGGVTFIVLGGGAAGVGLGVGFLAVSAVFAAAFVYNAVTPSDREESIPGQSTKTAGDWHACDAVPVSDVHLIAMVGSHRFEGTTGADGRAVFDLTRLAPTAELVRTAKAEVRRLGGPTVDIDLSSSAVVARWKAALDEGAHRARP